MSGESGSVVGSSEVASSVSDYVSTVCKEIGSSEASMATVSA